LFTNVFKITRPQLDLISFQEIVAYNKHIVIQHNISGITLRGQFELVGENILFVGFAVVYLNGRTYEQRLTFEDFAPNDPSIDLLHVLNNADNTSKEKKELLTTINDQKNKLKQANKKSKILHFSYSKSRSFNTN
jgi:hypothetical protein